MECPYCGAELEYEGEYGNFRGGYMIRKVGDIYECPHKEGFLYAEDAERYRSENPELINTKINEIVCGSSTFNGFFYVLEGDSEVKEGYPC